MRGNRSDQHKRGQWNKDKAERGVFQRGRVFYIRFANQEGKMQVERVGPSKALALKVIAKRRTQVAECRFFPGANVTFDELLEDAIAEARRNHALKGGRSELYLYRYNIVKEWFKGRRAATITPQEIDKKLADRCRTPANYNRYRVAISHAYKLGIRAGKAVENPASLVRLKKEDNIRVRFLEPEEETALRAAIRDICPEHEPEFDLALYTGMRLSEQYGLRWAEVDLQRNRITLTHTKSGQRQYVRLNAAARAALERLRDGGEFVCHGQDKDAHRKWWETVRERAGVKDFTWHDLRHTFASRLVMNGVGILDVNKLMRHETLQVTMRYAHLSDAHLQRAVERLDGVSKSDTVPRRPASPVSATIQ